MKHSAAKTLGVAALGAAFAVSAAGSASALTTLPTDSALKTAKEALPVGLVASALPGGPDGRAATRVEGALDTVARAASAVPTKTPHDPVTKLLGGLPVEGTSPVTGLG
ncbi:ATP-binding protein [Streptomyces roseolilacinus]|uniref:ATP-binding protein n=1 Tax=Streptomyces roseolilacinus TaxID=66904 RepID=UPI00381D591B